MSRIKKNEDAIKYSEKKLQSAPEGTLYLKKIQGSFRYYAKGDDTKSKESYLGAKNIELIKQLQEKGYYEDLKKTAEENLVILKKIQKLENRLKSPDQVFFEITEGKRNLIRPYVSSDREEIKRKIERECKFWEREKNVRKGVPRELSFVTLNGERVRSKSELIIADRLKNAGIRYFYEGKYVFEDVDLNCKKSKYEKDYEVWYPDFQVLNSRTGDLYLWEHFGLIDDPEYCDNCQSKIEIYAKHGIVTGKNLIVTTESSGHPLNVAYVDKLIEEFLK